MVLVMEMSAVVVVVELKRRGNYASDGNLACGISHIHSNVHSASSSIHCILSRACT